MNPSGPFKVMAHSTPHIVYENTALQKLLYLIKHWDLECQWYHRLDREYKNGQLIYHVHDIFIPPQQCKAAEIDTDGGQVKEMWDEIKEQRKLDMPALGELMKNTSVWCHSHVNMPAKPSGQDDTQWAEQLEAASRAKVPLPQAMLIFNKKNEYYSRIYDPHFNVTFEQVPIVVDHKIDFSDIDEALDKKLQKVVEPKTEIKPFEPSKRTTSYGQNFGKSYGKSHENWFSSKNSSSKSASKTSSKTSSGKSGNFGASSHGSKPSSSKSGGGSAALRKKLNKNTSDYEDWEKELLSDQIMKLSTTTMHRIMKLVKEINKTGKPSKSAPLIEELAKILDENLVNDAESWYVFRILTTADNGEQISDLVDFYLKTAEGLQQKFSDDKQKFLDFLSTHVLEPPEMIAKALQVVAWLDLSTDPETIEGLIDKWIFEYYPEYYDDENTDDDKPGFELIGGSGYPWDK